MFFLVVLPGTQPKRKQKASSNDLPKMLLFFFKLLGFKFLGSLKNEGTLQELSLLLYYFVVGGFNPFEEYDRQNGNLPQIGMKMKNA